MKLYYIGGCVRDEIMGLKPKDLDIVCTGCSWDEMRQEILTRGGKIYIEKPEYLTMRASMPGLKTGVDFVLARKDGVYEDGRRPKEVSAGTLLEDQQRRDFRMNSIARDFDTGEIIDPFNGREDIEKRVIRCVGDPLARFTEDKLRVFRAIRFAIQKNFDIMYDVHLAIKERSVEDFVSTSTQRIREEVGKMLLVNTKQTFRYLYCDYPQLGKLVDMRGIWFEPTTKQI